MHEKFSGMTFQARNSSFSALPSSTELWAPVAAWAPLLGSMECGWYGSVCSHMASKAHKY